MVTSAPPSLRRAPEPLKITSVISPPRRLLALCSPSTQRTASTTLLLPEPFGPTTAVTPGAKENSVLSANDLKPTSSRRLSMRRHPCLALLSHPVRGRKRRPAGGSFLRPVMLRRRSGVRSQESTRLVHPFSRPPTLDP